MKKQNILLVLKVLESETDKRHPMTQSKIAEIISAVYPCDRKTVGRNIGFLVKMGYPIKKTSHGCYLDRKLFSIDERELVLSTIRNSPEIDEQQKENILDRLTYILNRFADKKTHYGRSK